MDRRLNENRIFQNQKDNTFALMSTHRRDNQLNHVATY